MIHWPPLYRTVHTLHHNNVNPGPWSGLAMHPVEHLLYFSGALIHLIVPSHPFHAAFHLMHAAVTPAQGHVGFDKVVVGEDSHFDTHAFAHYLHHKYFECNYADGAIPLDRWFGTFHGRHQGKPGGHGQALHGQGRRGECEEGRLTGHTRFGSNRHAVMKYRSFARTDWQVSEIGFGAWQLGGSWGTVDDLESLRTLHYAFEKGVNFVDTAELYGNGHSEAVIGEALRQWRGGRIYVATKVQPTAWPEASHDDPPMLGRYPAWHLRGAVEASLRRLGVERIDLFQLHCWVADGSQALDWLETLNALRQDGKVDQIGVSIRDYRPEEGVDIARFGLVNAIQVIFNMFEQVSSEALLPAAAKSSTAVIARVPLDSGSLAGHWTEDSYAEMEPGSVPHTLFRGARFGGDAGSGPCLEGALRTVLSDAGRGRHALRPQ